MQDLEKVRAFYEENVYGHWREGEQVTYQVLKESRRHENIDSDNPFAGMFRLSTTDEGVDVEITVTANNTSSTFTVRAYLPEKEAAGRFWNGCPYIVCMHPIQPRQYALEKGYAVIFMDTAMVAEDNHLHRGAFYDLYPYTQERETQTGELMAWGWAASKVLDAVYGGLDKELNLDREQSMITGVSRWGKATAVCGAFEKRFKMTIPVCSGAGGLALWGYKSEGKSYDLSMYGGPTDYEYGKNEPLDCLQSEAERGWFVDRFLQYEKYEDIEVEQYMLPVLAAGENRHYFVIAAWMGEDWVNAPAMWECAKIAEKEYEKMGLSEHFKAAFHKEGHAVLQEDMVRIIEYFEQFKC